MVDWNGNASQIKFHKGWKFSKLEDGVTEILKTNVSSIEPLKGLKSLEHLDCSQTYVTDLTPMTEMTSLNALYCHDMRRPIEILPHPDDWPLQLDEIRAEADCFATLPEGAMGGRDLSKFKLKEALG